MKAEIEIEGHIYRFDMTRPIDISIPLQFDGPQPNAYGVPPAASEPCVSGSLIGDTRRGGSCNFEQYTFIPHCNGTHTECVGHITHERIALRECLTDVLIPAWLLSVEPEIATSNDLVITHAVLKNAIGRFQSTRSESEMNSIASGAPTALILRTIPNDESKLSRKYTSHVPPYFSTEAMDLIVECGFKHLLVDLPSIDRLYDEGKLINHRLFWGVEPGSFVTNGYTAVNNTITELIFVPNEVEDGAYFLNLQIAPFESDASPSRPVLFRIEQN